MKKIFIAFVLLTSFAACDKSTDTIVEDNTKKIIVRQIDAICGDAIFEIVDSAYKKMGDQYFEYKGAIYNGVFFAKIPCSTLTPVTGTTIFPSNNLYTVTLSTTPFAECNKAICLATLAKRPSTTLYIK